MDVKYDHKLIVMYAVMLNPYNFHHLLERNNQWEYINTKQMPQNLLVKGSHQQKKYILRWTTPCIAEFTLWSLSVSATYKCSLLTQMKNQENCSAVQLYCNSWLKRRLWKDCGNSAEILREQCGKTAETVRKESNNAEMLQKRCGRNASVY